MWLLTFSHAFLKGVLACGPIASLMNEAGVRLASVEDQDTRQQCVTPQRDIHPSLFRFPGQIG